jgi:A/G-specific adenine glycosylase
MAGYRTEVGLADAPSVPAVPPAMRTAILAWYDERGRTLPFRGTNDPYEVLVSEVMAQQTQIARVAERWASFIARFPSFAALASATPADVLREWRGLGYNRRAVGLWRIAGIVMTEHGGRLPTDLAALQALPGIGPYTARAVSAIAFGSPVGAVDTNVRRVLERTLGGPSGLAPRLLQATADAAVPPDRAAEWTHALMDLGATCCRSREPRCEACPARRWCRFAAAGSPSASGPVARPRGRSGFTASTRWLRGRIVERLADEAAGAWVRLDQPIGVHDQTAVARALRALASDGLIELDPSDGLRARLPLA